jgi:hypothetical protein
MSLASPAGEPRALGKVSFELIDNRVFVDVMKLDSTLHSGAVGCMLAVVQKLDNGNSG